MKPDIHVSLNPEVLESDAKEHPQHRRVSLKKSFQALLRGFFLESHPEGDEIPEGILPESFNCPKKDNISGRVGSSFPKKIVNLQAILSIIHC